MLLVAFQVKLITFFKSNQKQIKIHNFFMKDEFIDESDIIDQYKQSGISPENIYKKYLIT